MMPLAFAWMDEKAEEESKKRSGKNTARRSVKPLTLALNRRHRDPGPSSCAGL